MVKERQKMKRISSAVFIQRMYRRCKDRKQQLEKVRQRNKLKKLQEEEEDKYY
jgi:hypothetical protein